MYRTEKKSYHDQSIHFSMKRAQKYVRAGRNSDKAYVWYMKHQVIQKPSFIYVLYRQNSKFYQCILRWKFILISHSTVIIY